MFSQPNLSQSEQPNAHYDYDGLSGAWLWLPWWVHIIVAMIAWPMSWWLLPMLPFKNVAISEFLFNYKIQIASAISILTVMTAFLSYLKAYRIRNRQPSSKVPTKAKQATSVGGQKKVSPPNAQPKAKTAVKKSEEHSVTEAKPKKTAKKSSDNKQKASKANDVKGEKKSVAKKKRTTRKKNDRQTQLDF